MRSADLIVHYEVFYYEVVPHYEPHSWTSVVDKSLVGTEPCSRMLELRMLELRMLERTCVRSAS